ncbi:MAG TPA: SURF1 family cytochrome oxidase biogenesis protein [Candidatus Nanopelagicaceae bacterium]|nr:SURF1 family cytochrome oxidase biogenesis protein [Candidatus Nanopelagicaceae bacterium]
MVLLATARLGVWQMDRAAALKESARPMVEQPVVALSTIAKPRATIAEPAINRMVEMTGVYDKSYQAPSQVDSAGRTGTWQVAALRLSTGSGLGSAVLVVRGVGNPLLPVGQVRVVGRYEPSQFQDVANYSPDPKVLTRIDSALLLSSTSYDFYDGYVIASSESPPPLDHPVRVPIAMAPPHIPGFYWQHLAYMVLWWFFGVMVLLVWLGVGARRKT